MAYFECIIGGAGTTLTVTCDSAFAGKTITCTDGTTTLTAVCPSASPYVVEFDLENDGTWTISGTISGTTHSTSITIETSATLHEIPNGSTITPVANIQTWLHCANIWDKTYTTISQVLADSTTLIALISSNNAVDYMARSTSWASSVCANQTAMGYIGNNDYCANKLLANSTWRTTICDSTYFESVLNVKVPTMTSNTAPSGEVIASGSYSNLYPYKAFDGDIAQPWQGSTGASGSGNNEWCGYKFTSAVKMYLFKLDGYGYYASGDLYKAKVQASNDLSTWVDVSNETECTNGVYKTIIAAENVGTAYQYFRFIMTYPNGSTTFGIYEAQMYGRT